VTTLQNLQLVDTTPDGWNRPPDPAKAKRIHRAQGRRKRILAQARRLMMRRTLGGDDQAVARLEKLAGYYAKYTDLGVQIISLELL
jgi:hypothetical protein